jgi:hypothetical protein
MKLPDSIQSPKRLFNNIYFPLIVDDPVLQVIGADYILARSSTLDGSLLVCIRSTKEECIVVEL